MKKGLPPACEIAAETAESEAWGAMAVAMARAAEARELSATLARVLGGTSVHRRRMQFLGALRKDRVVYVPRLGKRCLVKKVDRVREVCIVEVGKMRMEIPFEDVSWLQPL